MACKLYFTSCTTWLDFTEHLHYVLWHKADRGRCSPTENTADSLNSSEVLMERSKHLHASLTPERKPLTEEVNTDCEKLITLILQLALEEMKAALTYKE